MPQGLCRLRLRLSAASVWPVWVPPGHPHVPEAPRVRATLHQGEKERKDVPNSILMLHSARADRGTNPNQETFPEDKSMMFKVSN